MNRLTEAAQNMTPPQGIKGRQIKIAELTSLKCRQTGHSDDEARLRSYLSTWDNLIYGINRKIDDGVLLAVFIENVRHLRCMRPDIERWDRDETVRSFAWLYKACQDCVERWQKRQNTLQMYQTFHEQRSRSGSHSRERDRHPGAPGVVRRRRYDPLARKSDPSPSRSVRCTSGTATTGCMASAPLSNANTCMRSRLRSERSQTKSCGEGPLTQMEP